MDNSILTLLLEFIIVDLCLLLYSSELPKSIRSWWTWYLTDMNATPLGKCDKLSVVLFPLRLASAFPVRVHAHVS